MRRARSVAPGLQDDRSRYARRWQLRLLCREQFLRGGAALSRLLTSGYATGALTTSCYRRRSGCSARSSSGCRSRPLAALLKPIAARRHRRRCSFTPEAAVWFGLPLGRQGRSGRYPQVGGRIWRNGIVQGRCDDFGPGRRHVAEGLVRSLRADDECDRPGRGGRRVLLRSQAAPLTPAPRWCPHPIASTRRDTCR